MHLRSLSVVVTAAIALVCLAQDAAKPKEAPKPEAGKTGGAGVLEFTVKDISGGDVPLAKYKGKVLLIVNVASKCGLTPQYEQLQTLHEKHAPQGLAVLAFPCNDFGGQEPGTNGEIAEFCKSRFKVSFDLFSKIAVKGDQAAPLYRFLTGTDTNAAHAGEIKWNFTKFLVDRSGKVIARFEPRVRPDAPEITAAIEKALSEKP